MHCLQASFFSAYPEQHDNTNIAKDPTNRFPESRARASRTNKMSQRAGAACNGPMMLRWQSQWEPGPAFCGCEHVDGGAAMGQSRTSKERIYMTQKELAGDAMHVSQLIRQNLGVWFESSTFPPSRMSISVIGRWVGRWGESGIG